MWGFEYLANTFWDIHDWAADLRDDLYALPWPLSYLGYPFDWFRYHMWWAAFCADWMSTWADDVWDRLADIPTWYNTYWLIRKYFPLLDKTWYDITNYVREQINRIEVPRVPSYSEIFRNMRSMFVSTYSILSETKNSIIYETMTTMRRTYSILYETRDSIVDAAIAKVRSTFPILTWSAQDFLKWMGIDAGDVITTILDTPGDMFSWIRREIERAYSILSETKDSIIDAAVAKMRSTYSILSETKDTIIDATIAKMRASYSILSETKDSIIDATVRKMKASFPILTWSAQDFLKWMGIDAGDVITTILDTPGDMFSWIRREIERAYSILSETKDSIIDATVSSMIATYNILSHTWENIHELVLDYLDTLQDWSQDPWDDFVTKILAALPHIPSIDDVINYVGDRFESILDRLFKEGD